MRREALLLVCAACGTPEWVRPTYAPAARAEAIDAAARDYGCPIDQVHVRCDASTVTSPLHGQAVVYDDGPVGAIVDGVPHWELELEVCGHVRRYGHDAGDGTFVERERRCEHNACIAVDPPCRSVARGTWWPTIVDRIPDGCEEALYDDRISAVVEAGRLEVVFANASTRRQLRVFDRDCREPSLLVSVDDQWFALCGDAGSEPVSIAAGATHRIASGLALGAGAHRIEVVHREQTRCVRSHPLAVTVSQLVWTGVSPRAWSD